MKVARLSFMLVALAFLGSLTTNAQVREFEYFTDPNAAIVDFSTTTSAITVPDNFTISTLAVMVDIDHAAASDLVITLSGPTGTYTLSTQNGMAGANYENTIFDSNPTGAIPGVPINSPGNVTAYFRGIYIPESSLPTTGSAAGTWTLSVADNLLGDNGTLVKWGLIFNRYDNYRDIRWGMDLNNMGVTTLNSFGLVDDVTTIPPYTVQGYRPLNNIVTAVAVFQLSQVPGVLNATIDHKYPGGPTSNVVEADLSIPAVGAYAPAVNFALNNSKGTHEAMLDLMMRTDLWMSRSDNNVKVPLDVTPGSLAFDNGVAQNTLIQWVNECDALTYSIYSPQTITSVDVWQGSVVELEPNPSTSQMTINVWDQNTNALVATTGPVAFPPQGQKWVSYPFTPPVALPAGAYRVGVCLNALDPGSFGAGIGMDWAGSPFEPLGSFGRYASLGLQWVSFDGGSTWNPENFRAFSTTMIRPNFVQQSDVGVIAINHNNGPGGMSVSVTFGAYAHYSWLPNQMTFGKVTILNGLGQTVGYAEKRVYLQSTPYVDTQNFNFPTLTSGNYTIRAEIVRPDDENLINNVYERTINIPFAPMIVSTPGAIAGELKNQIISTYAQQGIQLEFVDRNLGFEFPVEGKILWVGNLDKSAAAQAREFVMQGGDFAVLPDLNAGNPLTETFKAVATQKEVESMNRALALPSSVNMRNDDARNFISMMADNDAERMVIGKRIEDSDSRIASYFASVKNANELEISRRSASNIVYANSGDTRVEAVRMGDLAIVQLLVKDSKPARQIEAIANAAQFEITQNYPNPFNPTTNIAYNVPSDANVTVRVYDMLGREVSTLAAGFHTAGKYITSWNATNSYGQVMASGIYMYRLEASPVDGSAPFVMAKKMILSR
ncbi:MAG: T9SS type A sorting domain-containing protein [Bacteroidia bacterium]|nr:T9SS type A sorting domain-containing protein [Bacteroidia bacterium]